METIEILKEILALANDSKTLKMFKDSLKIAIKGIENRTIEEHPEDNALLQYVR